MLYIFIAIILLFPLYISLLFYYSKKDSKLYFAVILLKKITIISGFITKRNKGGFYIHLKNKAIIMKIKLKDIFNSGLKPYKWVTLNKVNLINVIGVDYINSIFTLNSVKYFLNVLIKILTYKNKTFNYSNSLIINTESEKTFNLGAEISINTSLIRIVLGFIANYISIGLNYVKKAKK